MQTAEHLRTQTFLEPTATGIPLRLDQRLFCVLLVLIPIMLPFVVYLFDYCVILADIAFVAVTLVWAVALLRSNAQLRWSCFYLPLVAYLAAMLLSTLFSAEPQVSARRLFIDIYLIALAVLAFNLLTSVPSFRRVAQAWMIGTAITASAGVVGVVLFYAGIRNQAINLALSSYGSVPPGNYPRIRGLFLNMNMCCNYLSVSFLLALAMRRLNWLRDAQFWFLISVIWVTGFFTLSPGIGGLLVGGGLWGWFQLRSTRPRVARILLVVGLIGALGFIFLMVLMTPRLQTWGMGFSIWRHHPVLGLGVGLPLPGVPYRHVSGEEGVLTDAHNVFLNIAALKGTLGLLSFLALIAYLLRKARPFTLSGDADSILRTTLAIALIQSLLYQGLGGSYEHTRHIWILMGMLAATIHLPVQAEAQS